MKRRHRTLPVYWYAPARRGRHSAGGRKIGLGLQTVRGMVVDPAVRHAACMGAGLAVLAAQARAALPLHWRSSRSGEEPGLFPAKRKSLRQDLRRRPASLSVVRRGIAEARCLTAPVAGHSGRAWAICAAARLRMSNPPPTPCGSGHAACWRKLRHAVRRCPMQITPANCQTAPDCRVPRRTGSGPSRAHVPFHRDW